MDKRTFIKNSLGLFTLPALINETIEDGEDIYADNSDEHKWRLIRKDYKLNNFINLENGYYCITPQPILKKFIQHLERVNTLGAYYMRNYRDSDKEKIRKKLSELIGCSTEELAITRNTTESIDLVISGFNWKEKDEVVYSNQDYGAMINMFQQVEKRYGLISKVVDVPLNPKSDDEIVKLYESVITPKTKLLMVCHMINITGHILPIKKICEMAHSHNVQVLVDGAHCIGQLDFKIDDLDCDYYGASLHKWLSNPIGAGILYINKKHIPNIWPLLASWETDRTKIQSLNHIGTHPVYTDLTISDSIDYYLNIGKIEKENRLRKLQNYWVDQLRNQKNIIINTPEDKTRSCAIANVGIKGINPSDLAKLLFEKYKIYTVAIDGAGVHGCRITPNIYTTFKELDVFIKAMKEISI